MISLDDLPRLAEVSGMVIRPSSDPRFESESEREINELLKAGWELLAFAPMSHPTEGVFAVASVGRPYGGGKDEGGKIAAVRLIVVPVLAHKLMLNDVQIHLNTLLKEGWVVLRADPMASRDGAFVLYMIARPHGKANKRK